MDKKHISEKIEEVTERAERTLVDGRRSIRKQPYILKAF